ncbi:aspartate dehydrogenase [Paenibacillus daejeonensis]|uniref:aspartate dehydrogenase n=1 Tax=Paenibacillus daejeonensis TaxID=135193 RepID=UPI00038221E0|nr:aspartate dehydrogenase [Paenibacillus daejeonensis]
MNRIGIIGLGTIGEDVAAAIHSQLAGAAELAAILVRNRSRWQDHPLSPWIFDDPEAFHATKPTIVVESAGHEAVRLYGRDVLANGADLIIVSVGALADETLLSELKAAAEAAGRRIIVPSAAIGGLDRIAAGSLGPMEEVSLTTRKPPKAWYGTVIEREVDLGGLTEPYTAYEGIAREAALLFPESVNVSAALSLAGVGMDETKVKVIVDPGISRNMHEIVASGRFGRIRLELENTPSASNPKTGYIVAMSVVKAIRDQSSVFVIGI